MKPIGFYQSHLDRVSRSFAFCIARLDGEMRLWVALSYLLCRVLDTVEDAPWQKAEIKADAFHKFQNFMSTLPTSSQCEEWANLFPDELPAGEKTLLTDAFTLFSDFHELPEAVKNKIRKSVMNMSRGMQHFSTGADLHLRTLAEVNQYCFFVAGLVGELLTDLLLEKAPQLNNSPKIRLNGHHFGLFLQKINLLKDQKQDEKEGRFLVHSRTELIASLSADVEGALAYLQDLPVSEKGYRLFCAWCLYLGIASLPWIQRGFQLGILGKMPRFMTEKLLANVERMIDDNGALVRLFYELLPSLPKISIPAAKMAPLDWFTETYEGALTSEHLLQLGMLPS